MSGRDSIPPLLPPLAALAEMLLDAAVAGEFERALQSAQDAFGQASDQLDVAERVQYRALFFDTSLMSAVQSEAPIAAAVDLLAEAFGAGADAWAVIRRPDRLAAIERLALASDQNLELLELMSCAPDAGIRGFAVSHLVSQGMRWLDAGADSRQIERLLHAVGATSEAYRLEAFRKQRQRDQTVHGPSRETRDAVPGWRVLAVAGGTHQLHATASSLFGRHGMRIVVIPSSRESVRRERDIVQALQGCELVVLLVRQITHSTSDQVRKAAERLGIPVVYSNAASAIAIERQLFERFDRS